MAGIKPDDVDLLMGYDSFTITALLHLEDLGFCAKGEGGAVRRGRQARPGRLAADEHQRRRALVHPPGPVRHVPARRGGPPAARRVRRAAGDRPARSPSRTVPGGVLSTMGTIVLGTEAARDDGTLRSSRRSPKTARRSGRRPATSELVLPWCVDVRRSRSGTRARRARVACADDARVAAGGGHGCRCTRSSVQHLPGPVATRADGPYAVALVDLAEGVRMMSNVVDCAPDAVTVGMAVHVTLEAARPTAGTCRSSHRAELESGRSRS